MCDDLGESAKVFPKGFLRGEVIDSVALRSPAAATYSRLVAAALSFRILRLEHGDHETIQVSQELISGFSGLEVHKSNRLNRLGRKGTY